MDNLDFAVKCPKAFMKIDVCIRRAHYVLKFLKLQDIECSLNVWYPIKIEMLNKVYELDQCIKRNRKNRFEKHTVYI